MKNFYEVLGLSKDSSATEIKKAYRKLAIVFHPDKGGNAEAMKILNDAYGTLSDSDKRKKFNKDWDMYSTTVDEENLQPQTTNLLDFNGVPYSYVYRKEHETCTVQYKHHPLKKGSMLPVFKSFNSNIYHYESRYTEDKFFSDIFSFVEQKESQITKETSLRFSSQILTSEHVIFVFIDFLSGRYFSLGLEELITYLENVIKKLSSLHLVELPLYEGVYEIIYTAKTKEIKGRKLFHSIKKITDYAKQVSEKNFHPLVVLLHNRYYRNLVTYVMHLYWQEKGNVFDPDHLDVFDGLEETKSILNVLKERLANNAVDDERSEHLRNLIRYINLLYKFEKTIFIQRTRKNQRTFIGKRLFLF